MAKTKKENASKSKKTPKMKPASKGRKTAVKNKKKTTKKVEIKINKKAVLLVALCVCLITGTVFAAFLTHSHHNSTPVSALFDKDELWGIDVSAHNGKIDWNAVSEKADFAFIRVGYRGYSNGSLALDKRAKYNLKHAKRAGMNVGVYFYSQAVTVEEAIEEADFVLDVIADYRVTLPVAIDYEYAYDGGDLGGRLWDARLSKNDGGEIVRAFCDRVKESGYMPAVYASSDFYRNKINTKMLSKDTVIWVADYNKLVTYTGRYDIWQYSKTGECDGVSSKYVDTNHWYLKRK